MTLADFIHRNRTAILGTTSLLVAVGFYVASTIPVGIFPEVAFHRITVIAHTGNLPVDQTLTAVTQPLESAMTEVLGVETIRSTTTRGGVQMDLIFGWNEDMNRALQLVQAATEEARGSLAPGTEIEARPLDTSAFPIVGVALTSRRRSLADLSDFAIYEAAPRLRTIPGVYRVELNGAKIREYALTVDPEALVQHHLDLAAVEAAVRSANVIAAGGRAQDGYRLTLAVVRGAATEPHGLLDTVVSKEGGVPVTLGQIATIEASLREDFTRASADGRTAVLLGISRQPNGNAVSISAEVHKRVTAMARAHPEYEMSTFYDQAELVREAIASVRDSIAVGLFLAVATIFFFIADVRTTLVAAAVIPATILITCVLLRILGMTFNLMTLGGIAAGIGLILDDAIVVVENLHRHRSLESGERAMIASMGEIAHALLGSTLTPVAVLVPLGLLSGVPGAFFRPLALTMSIALLVSLVLALSFTPALAAAVEPAVPRRAREGPGDRVSHWLATFYARGLRWTLDHRRVALFAGLVPIAIAVLALRHVETGFVPEMDEGSFVLDFWSPPGTSLEETDRLLGIVDDILLHTPEVTSFSRRTGAELGFFLTETNRGDYAVRLRGGRRRPIDEVMEDVRMQIHARAPGLRVEFIQILQDMIGDLSGNPSPVEVKLFGRDLHALTGTAADANALIAAVPGIVDNFDGVTAIGPTYEVNVDELRARRAGIGADMVRHWVETAMTGSVVGQVLEGDRAIPLRLWYPDRFRRRLDSLAGLTLITPQGRLAPLSSLARLGAGPDAIQRDRENLRQVVRVTAQLAGRDLGSVTRDVRTALQKRLSLPAGVTIEYGGLYASQRQAFRELLVVFFGSLALVSVLLLVEFGSLAAVVSIVVGSTLALSGSLLTLWLTHTPLNVSSIVGMIMVVGIVAKNGILLLDFAGRDRGSDLEAALVRAGTVRLRPILMTTLAAVAGLAPLALGIGAGAQMQQPLAIAILGGVSLSTAFSLIGVPLLYLLLRRQPVPAREATVAPTGR